MKVCARCLRELLLDCFNRNVAAKDGKQSWCRDCKRSYARQWLRNASPEVLTRHRELKKARRPRYRQVESESHKKWLRDNPDRTREHDAKRRVTAERKEWQAAYWKKWRAENLAKAREYARRGQHVRRARKAGTASECVDNAIVFERDEGICGICQEPVDSSDWHLDHIVPIALGGDHSYENVRVSHPGCNLSRPRGMRALDEVPA